MKLFYYKDAVGNFGDDLNEWLWPRLLPGVLDDDPQALFVGIGTLLNELIPAARRTIVFGAGVGYGKGLPTLDASWKIYCVRGPRSAQALGLAPELAITDASVLLRILPLPAVQKQYAVAFMPHHLSAGRGDWRTLCERQGIHYISPHDDVETVVNEIRQSELVLAEAMHGAIVADALRVPWIPVKAYPHILDFKWLDWTESLQLPLEMHSLPSLWHLPPGAGLLRRTRTWCKDRWIEHALRRIVQTARPQLSADRVLGDATARLQECLEQFKSDVQAGFFTETQPAGISGDAPRQIPSDALQGAPFRMPAQPSRR